MNLLGNSRWQLLLVAILPLWLDSCSSTPKIAGIPENLPEIALAGSPKTPPHNMAANEYPFDADGNYMPEWAASGERKAGRSPLASQEDEENWSKSHGGKATGTSKKTGSSSSGKGKAKSKANTNKSDNSSGNGSPKPKPKKKSTNSSSDSSSSGTKPKKKTTSKSSSSESSGGSSKPKPKPKKPASEGSSSSGSGSGNSNN